MWPPQRRDATLIQILVWILRHDMTCAPRAYEKIYYSHNKAFWGVRQASKQLQRWLERAGRGNQLGILRWLGGGTEVRVPSCRLGLVWFELLTSTRGGREQPSFLISLPRSREEGEERVVGPESCQQSNIKNGLFIAHNTIIIAYF